MCPLAIVEKIRWFEQKYIYNIYTMTKGNCLTRDRTYANNAS